MKIKLTPAQSEVVRKIQGDSKQAVWFCGMYYWETCFLAGSRENILSASVAVLIREKVLVTTDPQKDKRVASKYKINPKAELEFTERKEIKFKVPYIYEATIDKIETWKVEGEGKIQFKIKPEGSKFIQILCRNRLDIPGGRYHSTETAARLVRLTLCIDGLARAEKNLDYARKCLREALEATT